MNSPVASDSSDPVPGPSTAQDRAPEECFILVDPDTGFFSEYHDGLKATEELLAQAAHLSPYATLLEKTDTGWFPC